MLHNNQRGICQSRIKQYAVLVLSFGEMTTDSHNKSTNEFKEIYILW